ncbi:MAG: hypothetical protein G01um101430_753 [Parcubacteria group bacterium Gr01-1014_30]|nr:MAG: hypothetical protein G01um101430_753 [Parcubacteria group bacterium Gr01-1014_30]
MARDDFFCHFILGQSELSEVVRNNPLDYQAEGERNDERYNEYLGKHYLCYHASVNLATLAPLEVLFAKISLKFLLTTKIRKSVRFNY